MKHVRILFLGGAKRVSLAERFISAGRSLRRTVRIYSYELSTEVPLGVLAARIFIGLRWNDRKVLSHLTGIIRHNRIDAVIPFVDPAIQIAARLKERLPDMFIPVASYASCSTFYDKLSASRWFREQGVRTPEPHGRFPMIAKPCTGSAGKGILFFSDARQLRAFKRRPDTKNYLVQRFIRGCEYSVDAYVSQTGVITGLVARERLDVQGGEVMRTRTVRASRVLALAQRVIGLSALRGPLTVQMIREKGSGCLYVIEINPRFGGGVIASIEAGADFPRMLLQETLGMPVTPAHRWRAGLVMTRTYREVFYHADHH